MSSDVEICNGLDVVVVGRTVGVGEGTMVDVCVVGVGIVVVLSGIVVID